MDRLLKRDGDRYRNYEHIRRLGELFDDAQTMLMRALDAREPLSVICHGGWNRDTLLFQYDEHRRPFDATAIDYSTLHYGSPALDLSSFLYMSTTQPVREAHWDDLLDAYCVALAGSVRPASASRVAPKSTPSWTRSAPSAVWRPRRSSCLSSCATGVT